MSHVLASGPSLTDYKIGQDDIDIVYEILRDAQAPQGTADAEILKKLKDKGIHYELAQVQKLSIKDKVLL